MEYVHCLWNSHLRAYHVRAENKYLFTLTREDGAWVQLVSTKDFDGHARVVPAPTLGTWDSKLAALAALLNVAEEQLSEDGCRVYLAATRRHVGDAPAGSPDHARGGQVEPDALSLADVSSPLPVVQPPSGSPS